MLPIIRRTRRPLTDPEPATIVAVPEIRSDFGQFRSDSLASPAIETLSSMPASTLDEETASRRGPSTPGGQIVPPLPMGEDRGEGRPFQSTINNTSSTNPWSLQPGEPPADYQLFAAWLQLAPPRTMRKSAIALGCPVPRLRRLARHHNWQSRAGAFDNYRASATSRALDQLLNEEISNLRQRAERFRQQEWLLHEEMLEAAWIVVRDLKSHPRRVTLTELTRLFDIASTLGRRAAGLPLDSDPPEALAPQRNWDAESALNKIYGDSNTESPLQTD